VIGAVNKGRCRKKAIGSTPPETSGISIVQAPVCAEWRGSGSPAVQTKNRAKTLELCADRDASAVYLDVAQSLVTPQQ
jgi:hypothetical protein